MSSPASKQEKVEVPMDAFMRQLRLRDGHKPEFIQAVTEIAESLEPVFTANPELFPPFVRLVEPERIIQFRVAWMDDHNEIQVNRGFRVQYSSALGPYKGGLRFHPSVTSSVLEFLGLEQTFKNALTGLPLGGAKGGADFDPKHKSDGEIMRFCQSFMTELHKHIGANVDVPAGDIGVGAREIGYLFGMYKRLTNSFEGALTGKGPLWGGSVLRPEATGWGLVYFAAEAVRTFHNTSLAGKRVCVSGSGNVALHAAEQLIKQGALVLTLSDSNGFVHEPNGFTAEQLRELMVLKDVKRERLSSYRSGTTAYVASAHPFARVACDYAFPCATQNEVNVELAQALLANGLKGMFEGANMPSTNEAIALLKQQQGMLFGPSKACNAGGVAVSGLEMAQNSARLQWTADEVEAKLVDIMKRIFEMCKSTAEQYNRAGDLQFGANVAGLVKVVTAMKQQGCL